MGKEIQFVDLKKILDTYEFNVGGNWDYHHGFFDHSLDGELNQVWLRIPFQVVKGELDPENTDSNILIKIGEPFALRHLYKEGNDRDARFMTYGALVNQFQNPTDPDADMDPKWEDEATKLLKQIEEKFNSFFSHS